MAKKSVNENAKLLQEFDRESTDEARDDELLFPVPPLPSTRFSTSYFLHQHRALAALPRQHFATVSDVVGVVANYLTPLKQLKLRQVNCLWRATIDDMLEQKYDLSTQRRLIAEYNSSLPRAFSGPPSEPIRLGIVLVLISVLSFVILSVWPNDVIALIAAAGSGIFFLFQCSMYIVSWFGLSAHLALRQTRQAFWKPLLPFLPFGVSYVVLCMMIVYVNDSKSYVYQANSTLVAECLTDKYTGNSPPLQVLFLRPALWHFGPQFTVTFRFSSKSRKSASYKLLHPNTTVAGMNVDCTQALEDPLAYAARLADGDVGRPTQQSKFPQLLGFVPSSGSQSAYKRWPIAAENPSNPIVYQAARDPLLFGDTAPSTAVKVWTASHYWAQNRTTLVSTTQYDDLEGTILGFEIAMYVTLGICIVCILLLVVPLATLFVRNTFRRRRRMIRAPRENALTGFLKARATIVIVHGIALKAPNEGVAVGIQ